MVDGFNRLHHGVLIYLKALGVPSTTATFRYVGKSYSKGDLGFQETE